MSFGPKLTSGGGHVPASGGTVKNLTPRLLEVTPAAASATAILAATAMGTGAAITTGITQPDCARCLVAVGDAGASGDATINGRDRGGNAISEVFILNGTTPVNGSKAFASVSSVVPPAGGSHTIAVGTQKKIGLAHRLLAGQTLDQALFNGAAESGTLATDPVNLSGNHYTVAGTPDGAKPLKLRYTA